jgi:plasmid replication initiation protein
MTKIESLRSKRIVKANAIIEAKYQLSVREQKLFLYMVSMLRRDDEKFKVYKISIKDLQNVINPKETKWGSIYNDFREILISLKSKVLVLQEDDREIILNWVNDVTAIFGTGEIQFSFSENLKPYLLQLKEKFTEYGYYNIIQIKSSYSIRIYELLKQYELIRRRKFKVDELREILGIEKGKYHNYADFKRKVILTAEKELMKKTDIYFTFKEKKKGRKVDELEFLIFKNVVMDENQNINQGKSDSFNLFHNLPEPSDLSNKELFIHEQLIAIGFTDSDAKKIIKDPFQYVKDTDTLNVIKEKNLSKEEYIQEKIDYYRFEKEKKKIERPTGFIIQALKKNFWNERIEKEKERRIKLVERRQRIEKIEVLQKEKTKVGNERVSVVQSAIIRLNNDSPEILEEIIEGLKKESTIVASSYKYNKSGIDNYVNGRMLSALVNNKYIKNYAHLYPEIEKKVIAIDKVFKEIEDKIKKLEY